MLDVAGACSDGGEEKKSPRPDVPRYYRVACRFHDVAKVRKWYDQTKLFALYVLTTKHRNLEGFFILPPEYAAADLGWKRSQVIKELGILEADGFLSFDSETNLLLIRNALKYQQPDSKNVLKAVISRIKSLPENPTLLKEFIYLAFVHCRRKDLSPYAQALPELLRAEFKYGPDGS